MDEYGDEFESLDDLREAVGASGGVLTLAAWQIRDAYGAERLGSQVRTNISRELRGRGLGHFPDELPDRQNQMVRVFLITSPAGAIIEAALTPGDAYDVKLREAGSGADEVLDKIRGLVCP
ncbi:MAG: hypothetical protein ACK5LS_02615 [Propioniciclava sp.]